MKLRLAILITLFASAFILIDTSAQNKQPPKKDVDPARPSELPPAPLCRRKRRSRRCRCRPAFMSSWSPRSRTSSIRWR